MWPRHVTPQSRYLSGAENCGHCCVIVIQCPQNLAFPSSARSSTLWSLSVSTATRKLFCWIFLDGNQGIIFQCEATFGFALARSWCWRVVSSYRNKVSRTRNAMFDNSVAHQCEDNVISRTNVNLFDIFNGAVVSRWWKWMVGRTSDTFSDAALWCQGSAGFIKSSPTSETLLDIVRCCRVHSREVGERKAVSVGVHNCQQNLVVGYWSSLPRCDRAWDTTQSPYWIRSTQLTVTSL